MNILIIGTPRSGTTSLANAIGHSLSLKILIEPFHPKGFNKPYSPLNKNVVLKTLIQHQTFDDLKELSHNFDKVILLSRKNREDIWESLCNAKSKTKDILSKNGTVDGIDGYYIYHDTYVHNPNSLNNELKSNVDRFSELILNYMEISGVPITWYEDLYSTDHITAKIAFENLNIGVKYEDVFTYLDPSKKYRKERRVLI
jgi:hypothetical protein